MYLFYHHQTFEDLMILLIQYRLREPEIID